MPSKKSINDLKSALVRPSLSSQFEVQIAVPPGDEFKRFFSYNGVNYFPNIGKLNLLCCEATLPGSTLATLELTNSFHGVTERYPYRRIYDDRIDLTFYVDAENYLPIRFFETWMKYIVDESIGVQADKNAGSKSPNYFYRVRYPDGNGQNDGGYVASGLKVIKFERDYKQQVLEYEFIRSFPISITSIPISYESSNLLKCTVSMSYIRYVLNQGRTDATGEPAQSANANPEVRTAVNNLTPDQQAAFNAVQFGDEIEAIDIEYQQALESGDGDAIEAADIKRSEFFRRNGLPFLQF